ncbi:MAG TPA: hypothetical protein VF980_21100 [Thermoanaerobaculia bacterium]
MRETAHVSRRAMISRTAGVIIRARGPASHAAKSGRRDQVDDRPQRHDARAQLLDPRSDVGLAAARAPALHDRESGAAPGGERLRAPHAMLEAQALQFFVVGAEDVIAFRGRVRHARRTPAARRAFA